MKKIIWPLGLIIFCFAANAQQQDTTRNILDPMLFQVRLNPKDTAFRNTKFALPPFGFVLDYNAPLKTKAEVDSITMLINRLQQKVINKETSLNKCATSK